MLENNVNITGQYSNNVTFRSFSKVYSTAQNRMLKMPILGIILLPKLPISWNTTHRIPI